MKHEAPKPQPDVTKPVDLQYEVKPVGTLVYFTLSGQLSDAYFPLTADAAEKAGRQLIDAAKTARKARRE